MIGATTVAANCLAERTIVNYKSISEEIRRYRITMKGVMFIKSDR